jgi:ankyrin repeat protein/Tfp pilus assembly protein PilF
VLGAVKNNETDAVVMLIRRGADLNIQDYRGATPLWCAHGVHDGLTVSMLVTGGADPNKPACDGETPLLEAVRNHKEEKVRVLLHMGADPNADYKGSTGLHLLAKRGTWEMATWLLDAGADPTLRDSDGLTAFELAVKSGNDLVAHVLRPRPTDALLLAIASLDVGELRSALQNGANPTQSLSDGSTPLHQCARKRADGYDAARVLLEAGADPNSLDTAGNSPLSELIDANPYRPFVELLLEAGADPTLGEQSAFMLAQQLGNEELIAMLSKPPVLPKVSILTRSGFPHPAAQAASACQSFAAMGDAANALEQANRAVHEKPLNARYRQYRAILRNNTGDTEGALEDYEILIRDKPSWFDPKVDYGILLIENGRFAEGLPYLDEVMLRILGRPDAKLHYNRGRARAGLGDWTGALADLELANQTVPNQGGILRHLGKVQQALGEMEAACQSWQNAVDVGDTEAHALLAEFCQ